MRLQLFHLYQSYVSDIPSLVDLSLQVDEGEFVFLIGSSGAGKSTLLKVLFGEERPQSGQLLADGVPIHELSERERVAYRRQVGFVFQDLKLLLDQRVIDNIALPLLAADLPGRLIRRRCQDALQRVGLGARAMCRVQQLSGGERQRVAIARAIVNHPKLLLADEPTGSLDPKNSEAMLQLLYEASLRGSTVIVSTHDHEFLDRFPARQLRMERGRLVEDRR
ncbi:MAG: ATP-binding cassette domain-containing protein [Myxococcota bacterium]|nr:ATP-binding cassette domain-containing protein [Myxococcota bacterium]